MKIISVNITHEDAEWKVTVHRRQELAGETVHKVSREKFEDRDAMLEYVREQAFDMED